MESFVIYHNNQDPMFRDPFYQRHIIQLYYMSLVLLFADTYMCNGYLNTIYVPDFNEFLLDILIGTQLVT